MQSPFHHPLILATAALIILLGCYSSGGQPYDAQPTQWHQLAIDACQRGDKPAYEALIARADVAQDQIGCDPQLADDHNSMSDERP